MGPAVKVNPAINDRVIWITRPRDQGKNLCRLVEGAGGRAVLFPVIEIRPVAPPRAPDELTAELAAARLIIFVSRNAVTYVETALADFFRLTSGKQILAIGEGTRMELYNKGLRDVLCPDAGLGSEALLELEALWPQNVAGNSVLVVRGVGGRDKLEQTLGQAGVTVKYLEVYERRIPAPGRGTLENFWQDSPPDAIVITSVEGLHNLIKMTAGAWKERLLRTPLAVMSPRIRAAARSLGFVAEPVVAAAASDEGLLQATISIFEAGTT